MAAVKETNYWLVGIKWHFISIKLPAKDDRKYHPAINMFIHHQKEPPIREWGAEEGGRGREDS